MKKKYKKKILLFIALLLIYVFIFSTRYYFFSQTDQFSDDSSYHVLRQVESIIDTGRPSYMDPLSYGGREFFFTPLYHYILAAVLFFTKSIFSLKIINNLFASSIIISTYLLTKSITKNSILSFIVSFLSGVIPVFFQNTLNSLNPYSLFFPVLLLLIYYISLLKTDSKKYSGIVIFLFIFLIILSPLSLILIFGLLFNQVLVKIDGSKINKKEIEIFITSFFFYLWYYFIIYKRVFFEEGFSIIKQNIPQNLIMDYFTSPSPLSILLLIGVIPFFIGSFTVYYVSNKKKMPSANMLTATIIMILIFSFFNLLTFLDFLMVFGVLMTVISAVGIRIIIDYLINVKFRYIKAFTILIIILLVVPSLMMSNELGVQIMDNSIDDEQIAVFNWIKDNTEENTAIITAIPDGHLLTYFGQRKNIMDSNFLMFDNTEQRIKDLRTIYTSPFYSDVIRLVFERYGASYILVNDNVRRIYGVENIKSYDPSCFIKRYSNTKGDEVYQIIC